MTLHDIQKEITQRLEATHPSEHQYLVQRDKSFELMLSGLSKDEAKAARAHAYAEAMRICGEYKEAGIDIAIPGPDGIDFPDMSEGKNAHPLATEVNIYYALKEYGKFEFIYDVFTESYYAREKTKRRGKWKGLTLPEVRSNILMHLNRLSQHMRTNSDTLLTVCRALCEENEVDSGRAEFTRVVWDGEERLSRWLCKVTGTDDDYIAACGENWLQALAMRQVEPGYKFDYMLVISGPQGTRKTTMFETIGGKFYKPIIGRPEGSDLFAKTKGALVLDLDEGRALSLTDVNYMKGLLSARKDVQRAMYSQDDRERMRRFVFGMTTNASQFLRDATGNRRYLVIFIDKVMDTDWLKENRDQLLAEAYHRCLNGIAPKPIDMDEAQARQDEAFETDELSTEIEKWLRSTYTAYRNADPKFFITVADVYTGFYYKNVNVDWTKYNRKAQREIAEALHTLGFKQGKRKRINGAVVTPWEITEEGVKRILSRSVYIIGDAELANIHEVEPSSTVATQEAFDDF